MELMRGLSQIAMGIGIVVMIFAVYPATGSSPGVIFERAADFSRMKLEIAASRPQMMMWGLILLSAGLVISGGLGLLKALGMDLTLR